MSEGNNNSRPENFLSSFTMDNSVQISLYFKTLVYTHKEIQKWWTQEDVYHYKHRNQEKDPVSSTKETVIGENIFSARLQRSCMFSIWHAHQVQYMKYSNASVNKCQLCLPGQRAILQGLWCVSGPSQGLPPYWGGVHDLVRVLWPRPHVNEHKLQGDHSSQTPCTVIKQRSFSHKEKTQSHRLLSV